MWTRLWTRLRRGLLGAAQDDRDIDDEIRFHLAEEERLLSGRGQPATDAWQRARRAFGNRALWKEEVREVWAYQHVDRLRQDARYALRTFGRSPAFVFLVVGSLALGMAGTIAAFAFVNAIFFRPFPGVTDQDGLVEIRIEAPYRQTTLLFPLSTTPSDYRTLEASLEGLDALAAFDETEVAAALPEPRVLRAVLASENYFGVLGVDPAYGRAFEPEEARAGNAGVAVIAWSLWAREFGSDPSVVGRVIQVADQSVEIVGIAPRPFVGLSTQFLNADARADIWLPLALADLVPAAPRPDGSRGIRYVGRLNDGVTLPEIRAGTAVAAGTLARARGEEPDTFRTSVHTLSVISPGDRGDAPGLLAAIVGVPILVLLVACVNAANLLLARASCRSREIAVRLAIGASRRRIVRQLLVESLLLAFAAALVAMPLAWTGLRVAGTFIPLPMPMDATVVAAALATAALTAVGFGLVPAFRTTQMQPGRDLGTAHAGIEGGPTRIRARRAFVVAQIAVSLGLLAAGAQLLSVLGSLRATAGGTDPDRLLIAAFDLAQLKFSPEEASAFYDRLLDRVSLLPESDSAGIARRSALWYLRAPGGQEAPRQIVRASSEAQGRDYEGGYAGGDLFRAAGLRILEGRTFTPEDRVIPPRVAVINQPAAGELDGPVLGQIISVVPRRPEGGPREGFAPIEVRVVGVVEPALDPGIASTPQRAIYLPSPLVDEPDLALYARARDSTSNSRR